MKTIKKFSKAFLPCAIVSAVVIVFGIVGFFVRGINFGIDFVPGIIEEVRVAPVAMEVSYNGPATVTVKPSNVALTLVISGTGVENETREFTYGKYPTVKAMAEALSSVEGVKVVVTANAEADSYGLYMSTRDGYVLSSDMSRYLYVPSQDSFNIDDVRNALDGLNVSVKELGKGVNRSYQIRAALKGEEGLDELNEKIDAALKNNFGENEVAILNEDKVSSNFSSSLASKSIILAVIVVLLIWLYATIRFHWDFALGAIIALLHDCLIMFTFIFWTQVEFSTTTLAAVLTIFGYSINATVVILDRVRETVKLDKYKTFKEILDDALSGTLSRSIITTVTTLFASISLLIFTGGSIHDFAVVLTVGLISGCYSSIFISSGFIALVRKNWSAADPKHVKPKVAAPNRFEGVKDED